MQRLSLATPPCRHSRESGNPVQHPSFTRALLIAFTAWLALPTIPGWAEMLSFDSAEKWQSWTMPTGVVQVDAEGVLRLTKYRKEIDAIRDAHLFTHSTQKRGEVAGGIWQVGSGSATATNAIDGDPATFWQPDPS